MPVVLCNVTVAATVGTFFNPECFGQCESTFSEEDCVECAQLNATSCPPPPPPPPPCPLGEVCGPQPPVFPPPLSRFTNDQQTCIVTCPDGTTFSWIVPAGSISSFWKSDANARAYALACKRATEHRLCFNTESELSNACVGTFKSIVIGVFGGTSPYTFALTSGSLPAGMSLDPVGLITGTPTASGVSTFEITVTDHIGSTQVKEFSLRVINITTASPLPQANVNSAYSQTLSSVGNTFPFSWTSTSLPPGLFMSAAGTISGTPTTAGDYIFTATVTDFEHNSCSKDFSLSVVAVPAPTTYYKMDVITPTGFGSVMTPDALGVVGIDSDGNVGPSLTAGIIDNAAEFVGGIQWDISVFAGTLTPIKAAVLTTYHVDFTIRFWMRIPFAIGGFMVLHQFFPGDEWDFDFDGSNHLTFRIFGQTVASNEVFPTDNDWHRVIVARDYTNSLVKIKIDDFPTKTVPYTGFDRNLALDYFVMGGWNMAIDEWGFWKGIVWSEAVMTADWNGGAGTTYP